MGILKSLTEFDFPDGEPDYTKEVIDMLDEREKYLTNEDPKVMAIDRIKKKHPTLFE